jgi:hypothetical protein
VAQFVEGHAGASPSPQLVATLYRATAGNPLFLDGIVRLMRAHRTFDAADRRAFSDLQIR